MNINGIILSLTSPQSIITKAAFDCVGCGETAYLDQKSADLLKPVSCSSCGTIVYGDMFCTSCGQRIILVSIELTICPNCKNPRSLKSSYSCRFSSRDPRIGIFPRSSMAYSPPQAPPRLRLSRSRPK